MLAAATGLNSKRLKALVPVAAPFALQELRELAHGHGLGAVAQLRHDRSRLRREHVGAVHGHELAHLHDGPAHACQAVREALRGGRAQLDAGHLAGATAAGQLQHAAHADTGGEVRGGAAEVPEPAQPAARHAAAVAGHLFGHDL
jgi:hypothetical protein